jgi:uncharacterized integral membrane protein
LTVPATAGEGTAGGGAVRRLSWIVTLPITILAVLFALSNSATSQVRLWPFPWAAELPLYLLILGSLLLGFLLGAIVAWISSGGRRRRLRALSQQVRAQAAEIGTLREQAGGAGAGVGPQAAITGPASGSSAARARA